MQKSFASFLQESGPSSLEAMTDRRIKRVIVLGGGTAGWVAASMLARNFANRLEIIVIESADIGIVGVGEATIPPFIDFLRHLGVDEAAFIAATGATYKLGIVFENWRLPGHRYWHPFGTFGVGINGRPFHHFWLRAQAEGRAPQLAEHSLAAALGDAGKVLLPDTRAPDERAGLRYALHFDAALIGRFLRQYAEQAGVTRMAATVRGTVMNARGHIEALELDDGRRAAADLFIDCSGFRGVLIGDALRTPYVDWSQWLPVDRAMAVPTGPLEAPPPFTLSSAHDAGWRWQIPLQHRTGNGSVYCSRYVDEDAAWEALRRELPGPPLAEPRTLRFVTGRRQSFWTGNCVAVGLAAGFLEPLESTSIHLIISAMYKVLDHFPDLDFDASNVAAYNRYMAAEFEAVRDFIILHYCLTARRDTPFWRDVRQTALPDSLRERIALFAGTGRIVPRPFDLFTDASWFYVLAGMGLVPASYDPLADGPAWSAVAGLMAAQAERIAGLVRGAPTHSAMFRPA
jgi:tryptophan halogenase